ncbi:MAG: peptidoglycan DD-metalloendopeptidase family protein [Alistipes senegalensis]|nr:peptidoglycan DD-metalloendopeptidase family protein [Oxalobacter formigenes]MCM1281799.1 peptidoglycan DD-metalloendopeptidase family protein [Alistipes senegalensis]
MKRHVYPLLVMVCAGLAACSTSEMQAPIEDRSVGAAIARPLAGPGYYSVMKGDTLYRISRIYGQSVSDLVVWNNLGNANEINEGQLLRVVPPGAEGTAVQTASVSDSGGDVQPIGAAGESLAAEKADDGVSRTVEGIVWAWPATGNILRGFSEQSKGVDIGGAEGQKVLAAAEGRVIYAGTMDGYGNLVIIKHSDDLLSAYAHNSRNLVAQGSSVSRGQQVAEMGRSGTDAVKLHFEVRRQGKPVDPLAYLPKQ